MDVTQGVFERVLVRPTPGVAAALVSWTGPVGPGRVVQVYVNGRLHDVVRPAGVAGEAWLHVGADRVMRVELLAVPIERAWRDHAPRLADEQAIEAKAVVALVRDESLSVDARVVVEIDGERMTRQRLWGSLDARSGFGGLFGFDTFGFDTFGVGTATGVGHGLGAFGAAAFGADGTAWRWAHEPDVAAPGGEHTLKVWLENAHGQQETDAVEQTLTLDRLPAPAERVRVEDGFVLAWD